MPPFAEQMSRLVHINTGRRVCTNRLRTRRYERRVRRAMARACRLVHRCASTTVIRSSFVSWSLSRRALPHHRSCLHFRTLTSTRSITSAWPIRVCNLMHRSCGRTARISTLTEALVFHQTLSAPKAGYSGGIRRAHPKGEPERSTFFLRIQ